MNRYKLDVINGSGSYATFVAADDKTAGIKAKTEFQKMLDFAMIDSEYVTKKYAKLYRLVDKSNEYIGLIEIKIDGWASSEQGSK